MFNAILRATHLLITCAICLECNIFKKQLKGHKYVYDFKREFGCCSSLMAKQKKCSLCFTHG